jgi:uncharacterized protein YqjF (DUF2071 family)
MYTERHGRNPLAVTDHRPWPLPKAPWILAMQWHDLLFLHWPIPPVWLRPLIPPGLALDTRDGAAWLGIVPFYMKGTRPRLLPSLPWLSNFPELNVRTYVTAEGKPGVWFFTMDLTNPLAVRAARLAFHLPYFDARMTVRRRGLGVLYQSRRKGRTTAELVATYAPAGTIFTPGAGTLEHWLTERYCLYSADRRGRLYRAEIQHPPWLLQPATAEIQRNTLTQPLGFELPNISPLAHFARRQDVVAWYVQRVRAG